MSEYTAVHANVHGIPLAMRRASETAHVLALNEARPVADALENLDGFEHARNGSNALAWRTDKLTVHRVWRRTILHEKVGPFGWQESTAVAVLLTDNATHERVIHIVTHFPSKAWTVWRWRRPGWRLARRHLREFADDLDATVPGDVPILISLDGNRGRNDWGMRHFRMEAAPVTFGRRGRYDRWLARGAADIRRVRAFATGSDHLAVEVKVRL